MLDHELLDLKEDLSERITQVEELTCPTSSDSNYVFVEGSCYYFESELLNYHDAQANCKLKFGKESGHLAEPISLSVAKLIAEKARATIGSGDLWIGYDQIGHGKGNFSYVYKGLSSPLTNQSGAGNIDGANNEDCMVMRTSTPDLEDRN